MIPFQKWINKAVGIGLDDSLPEEEARIVMIHNRLVIFSSILLAPFPILFLYLGLNEGFYLIVLGALVLVLALIMNSIKWYKLSRFTNLLLGMGMFMLGVVFYGFDKGFIYGILALSVIPILYFRSWQLRLITYLSIIAQGWMLWVLFKDDIPIYDVEAHSFVLNVFLIFFCSLLVISYFLSLDWINQFYENKNAILVEKLKLRNEELEHFSYSASHDLKQPLRTILNFIGLFRKKKMERLDENELIYLKFIEDSAVRLNNLVDGLLKHSVLGQSQTFETFDCGELVTEVIQGLDTLIQESKAVIQIEKLPLLHGNRDEIGIVFQNLISNAVKFRNESFTPLIEINVESKGSFWEFKVKDNGVGIEKGVEKKIFQIFQKGHIGNEIPGTGIGLANCKKIIKMHSGDIWVKSKVGYGSTFHFTLKK